MTTRIVRLNGDPILRKKCKPVRKMDQRTSTLIEDMFNTMYEAKGVGLSAPQVGVLKRICVIDCGLEESQPFVLINPEIIYKEGEQTADEGCLSVPGYKGTVTRAQKVKVQFFDLDMKRQEIEAEGLLSRCIQHETDHLDGILYVDKVAGEIKEVDESNEGDDTGLQKVNEEDKAQDSLAKEEGRDPTGLANKKDKATGNIGSEKEKASGNLADKKGKTVAET